MNNPAKNVEEDRSPLPPVLWPIAVGVVLRVSLMLAAWLRTGTRVMTQGDSESYLGPARTLLHGMYASHGQTELDRTPGYPVFTLMTGAAFGNILVTVLAQIALAALTILLISRIAQLAFPDPQAAMISAWLFALDPASITSSVRIMPEALFVLLLALVLERLMTFHRTLTIKPLISAGLVLAAATFVRPVSYYLVFPLAVALAVTYRHGKTMRWKAPALLLLSVLPWLVLWQIRNAQLTGYSGFSSIVEKNLYYFQSAEVTAELGGTSLALEQARLGYNSETNYLVIHPEQQFWSQAQRLQFMRATAMNIISRHRALYFGSHFRGVALVAFTPAATEFFQLLDLYPAPQSMPHRVLNEGILHSVWVALRGHPALSIGMALFEVWLLLLYVFATIGSLFCRGSRFAVIALVGIALYFLLISGGAQAVGRYRLPIIPELCVLAGGGLAHHCKRKERNQSIPLP